MYDDQRQKLNENETQMGWLELQVRLRGQVKDDARNDH